MICADFVELAGLYVLEALSPEERAAATAHLEDAHHDGCFEALRRASAGAEVLARSLVPARPDDRVFRELEQKLGAVAVPARRTGMPLRERAAWGAAAAAAVLLLASVSARRSAEARAGAREALLTAQARKADDEARQVGEQARKHEEARAQCSRELASLKGEHEAQQTALALLQSPSSQVISLGPPAGQPQLSARALVDLAQKKGMLLSGALKAPAGKDYELWFIRGDRKLPAGLLQASAGGEVLASIDPQLFAEGRPDAVAITLEPAGGMPQPSGPIVLVGAFPKT